ncbi:MAG: protein phosphatase 2C domain-containing protein [Chloroflexota bacterium]|jgi:PPM family protein phosphatase
MNDTSPLTEPEQNNNDTKDSNQVDNADNGVNGVEDVKDVEETAVPAPEPLDTSPLTMVREPTEPAAEKEVAETRILVSRQIEIASLENPHLQAAKVSHLGAIRDRNEDSCLIMTAQMAGHFEQLPFGLYIVADGMGGHMNGHEASNMAIRVATRQIINRIYLPMLQDTGNPLQTPVQEVLIQAVEDANDAIFDPDPEVDGGTTLTIALIIGRRLHVAHVGDSRAYLLYDDRLEMVTDDHSLARRLQEVGQLPTDEEAYYNIRHVLLRAVGQGDELEVDTYTLRLPPQGRLLLCSDGLSGMITDAEIEGILRQKTPPVKTADSLCQAALTAGGHDNITAVVIDFNL